MLLESATGLVDAGARVVVALPERGMLVASLRAIGAEVVIVPMLVLRKTLLSVRGLPVLLRDLLRGWGAAWRLLRRIRPDVVYVSTIIVPQWPLVSRLLRIRAVSHVHEAEASAHRLINAVLYLPHLASRRVLVNSRFSLETIRAALPPLARRAEVVYNGVASPQSPPEPRELLDGPLRVLFVGRLSPRKGPDLVIDAAAALKSRGEDVRVTLLGAAFTGYEWFEDALHDKARVSGVDVRFAGFHAEIWPFLADTDVLVVPSRVDEPFGNTAVEGILARRPVIASDSSGLREAAGGYRTAWLTPAGDAAEIAAALERISARWPEVADGVDDSRAAALKRHSPTSYRNAVRRMVLDAPDV
ncbi:glycosyltransferase family 4 protein [Microbacterium sp. CIAB417]|uniref:glycosyltransferase family 4 protein n=1 Tax=Microbacterium sp. CIAB417 TaxID=2860287 RepID=UPI001FADFFEB|nr:glycosyltransferase family 4 protein [Microbacterium sp. CIAB417]